MSALPTGKPTAPNGSRFEIKSTQLSAMSLLIKSEDLTAVANDVVSRYGPDGENAQFFEDDLLVLDFSALPGLESAPDLQPLLDAVRSARLLPVAVRGIPGPWQEALAGHGLAEVPLEIRRSAAVKADNPVASEAPVPSESPVSPPVAAADLAAAPTLPLAASTLVVDKPLRSGQKVYARGGDLVVLAMVNQGAEVVADGNIHVYAPLRGKAMAGARGNTQARIFSLCLEPELVSIAGVYRTSENPFPPGVAGKPAQVRLSDDGAEKLIIEALKN